MIDGAVVLVHRPRPGIADICGLQAGGKAESEVDIRPLVLTMGGHRTDNCRSRYPLVHPRRRHEAFAKVAPLPLAEHGPIVVSASSSRRPATFRLGILWGGSGPPLSDAARSQSADASLPTRKRKPG